MRKMRLVQAGGLLLAIALGATVAEAAKETISINMVGLKYLPAMVNAKVGDVLSFNNDDQIRHVVYSASPGYGFDLGPQDPGKVVTLPLGKPGTINVYCVLHPNMKTTVNVTQ